MGRRSEHMKPKIAQFLRMFFGISILWFVAGGLTLGGIQAYRTPPERRLPPSVRATWRTTIPLSERTCPFPSAARTWRP